MADIITRRSALSTLAGASALATTILPAVANAEHPNQHLLDLGQQYAAALQVENTACDVWQAACEAYDEPGRRASLIRGAAFERRPCLLRRP